MFAETSRLLPIDESRRMLGGIGRTKFYQLAKADIRIVKIGRRSFVVEAELTAYIAKLMADRQVAS